MEAPEFHGCEERWIHNIFDLSAIPMELRLVVWTFLDIRTILRTQEVSKELASLAVDNSVWFELCKQFFWINEIDPQEIELLNGKGIFWKSYFAQRYLLKREDSVIFTKALTPTCILPRYRHSCTLISKPTDKTAQLLLVGGTGQNSSTTFGDVTLLEMESSDNLGVAWISNLFGGLLQKFNSSGPAESPEKPGEKWNGRLETKNTSCVVKVHPMNCEGKDQEYKSTRHCASFINGRLWIWGGSHSFPPVKSNNMILYDSSTHEWRVFKEYHGTPPSARSDHACATVGTKMFIIGGSDSQVNPLNDVHYFDTETLTWHQPHVKGTPPSPRSGHVCVVVGSKIYLYGGAKWQSNPSKWTEKSADTFVLDTATMVWTKINTVTRPSVSTFTAAFALNNFIWLVGGGSTEGDYVSSSVHRFDAVTNVWKEVALQPTDIFQSKDCVSATVVGSQVVLFGGFRGIPVNDLQIIDMTWHAKLKSCGLIG